MYGLVPYYYYLPLRRLSFAGGDWSESPEKKETITHMSAQDKTPSWLHSHLFAHAILLSHAMELQVIS